jgi:hypothetical protein
MVLTITDKIMRSDQTAHTAAPSGDGWSVTWLPGRLMDRGSAVIAMTLADLASEGDGIGLSDDPRWPEVDALAAALGLGGRAAVVRVSEPPDACMDAEAGQ